MMRPEQQILLACAQACSRADRKRLIASCLEESIDWEYLLQMAAMHMMSSQLFWNLNADFRDSTPQNVHAYLRHQFSINSRRNLIFAAELIRILDLFNKNNIPAIPFKGPSLTGALYEDPGVREFGDLDILLKEQDVFRGMKLLLDLKYGGIGEYEPATQSRILKQKNHLLLTSTQSGIVVELHWTMLPRYFALPLPIDEWWKRAKSIAFEGRSILALSPEDLLAALCVHACKHSWRSLDCLADLARLLDRTPGLDWRYLLSEYSQPDIRRVLLLGVVIAADLLNAGIPLEIMQMARKDRVVARLSREVHARMFSRRSEREVLWFFRFQLGVKSRWADRVRFLCRILTSPVFCRNGMVLPRIISPLARFTTK